MEDDLIASLTRQVREEVIENYLTQRRLLELQQEDLQSQAKSLLFEAAKTGRRLNRLVCLTVHPDMRRRLLDLLHISESPFWQDCLNRSFPRGVRFIRVMALTDKAKFRKLFLEAYHRLFQWMDKYRKAYEQLQAECQAVNINIAVFHRNFDLLTIISFLKSLDTVTLERKLYLGENFSAEEMASIDQKLHVTKVSFDQLGVPEPLSLPPPGQVEGPLEQLAHEVYRNYQVQVKHILK